MSVVVFRGPTVTADEVHAVVPDARCLPPAGQGDLHRAVLAGATVVALIDGTFERGPAVWHKEILHALANGVTVLGAASMGALRAAECAAYGMRGVGRIAAAYADGTLSDDDEVTVAHLDAEHDWRCISEALVNIRATLDAATAAGVLAAGAAAALVALAKRVFYPERSWPRLFTDAAQAGIDTAALRAWLPGHRVDAKRRDAHELLAVLAAGVPATPPVGWRPEPSRMWQRAAGAMAAEHPGAGGDTALDAVLDELRLDDAYYELHQAALLRHLAVADARRHGVDPDPADAVAELRAAFGLATADDVAAWCATNGLDPDGLRRLAVDQARLAWAYRRHGDAARDAVADQLRIRGRYPAAPPAPAPDGPVDEDAAWQWYAETRAVEARGWPDPRRGADQRAALAALLGFEHPEDLRRAVCRAYRSAAP